MEAALAPTSRWYPHWPGAPHLRKRVQEGELHLQNP